MTTTTYQKLWELEVFSSLGAEGKQLVEDTSRLLQYRVGQSMAVANTIPSEVLIILEGSARLTAHQGTGWRTVERLEPGEVVGLASLLSAAPCEEVHASSEVMALAIPDNTILKLHSRDKIFKDWCSTHLWTAELVRLVQLLQSQSAASPLSIRESVALLRSEATVRTVPLTTPQVDADHVWYVASANLPGLEIGAVVASGASLPAPVGPLAARLIGWPVGIIERLGRSPAAPAANGKENGSLITAVDGAGPTVLAAPESPLPTAENLGRSDERQPFKVIRGEGPIDETLACFQMLSRQMTLPFRKDAIEKVLRQQLQRGQAPNMQLVGSLASMMGMHVVGAKVSSSACTRLQTPSLVEWDGTFALLQASNARGIVLASPRKGLIRLSPQEVDEAFPDGINLLLVDRTSVTPEQKFGVSWFLPALKRHRGVLTQVLVSSFVVQLFTLANPLIIQVIIDKVISQRSLDTLQVLGIALVVVTLLEGVLESLRTFVFTETTNRIDTRLGAEVIDHLLRLPLGYFDKRPVGELGSRIAELEKIRMFLTGQALTTILDAAFSVIYIIVMSIYSWVLTLIALAVVPIQVALTVLGAPLFRRQYRDAAEENAKTQSHLVEVLTGIQTVKAQNVEMVSRWKWQDLYSGYISKSFEKTITGTALSQTSQVLQKLSQLMVLWVGATMVLKGELTLGQLIAFRILSGYVTQPLLRLGSIWQNIQELRVSFERLADVVDTPEESNEADKQKIPLPPVHGSVRFEDVTFRFNLSLPPVLHNVNLTIPSGTFVGVVGQSGSGKSTLMKLLARLYSPESGRILIDDYDIDKVELYSLRRQIGIVPQEPLLFSGTINENIALGNPNATSDDIVAAAKIACAHDFIMSLSAGYSTNIGERGAGLSGGQKQRIAIARTLITNPKLLVMDEATSALDYDTERRLCDNLVESIQGSTVFFITHRLSTIRRAKLIVMMDQGNVVEQGTHEELVQLKGRYYALYRQQEGS
jgi:ATP-binding cassette subfamily B protein